MSKNDQKVTNTVTTPTNPQWVTDASKNIVDQGQTLLGQDPKSFVAGPQGLNQTLFDTTASLAPNIPGAFQQANSLYGQLASGGPNLATGASTTAAGYNPAMMTSAQIGPTALAQGATAAGGIDTYMNPYTDSVVNQTLSDLDRARQMTQEGNGSGALLSGQYGGSRQGVLDSNANRDFYDRAGAAVGQLRAQGFDTALGAANSDADRAQQAGLSNQAALNTTTLNQAQLNQQGAINNQNANNTAWAQNANNVQQANSQNATLAQQNSQFNAGQNDSVYSRLLQAAQGFGGLGATGLDALSGAGATQQGIAQQQSSAPLSVYSLLSGDFSNAMPQLFQGSTQNQTQGVQSGTMSQIGNGLKIGSSLLGLLALSDARVKRDVETAGFDAKGRRWVDFRYSWEAHDAPKTRGVIAQEVAQTDPDAVLVHPTGFLAVNYDALEA